MDSYSNVKMKQNRTLQMEKLLCKDKKLIVTVFLFISSVILIVRS